MIDITKCFGEACEKKEQSKIYITFWINSNESFKNLKEIKDWQVDCDCSGYEYDRKYIQLIFLMPLPKEPN